MTPIDLGPVVERTAKLVEAVSDNDLRKPTPCEQYTVGDLAEHIGGAALAFTAAAVKQPLDGGGAGDAARLGPDWRIRIPRDVRGLADAWSDAETWTGMTGAGGVELPGEVAGLIGLDEMLVHGWDLAIATGQPAGYDGPELEALHALLLGFRDNAVDGIFGPEVDVPDTAPLFDRILGLTGRDPNRRAR
jgi:uncharacterized protein (TIGR03086 family)